MNSHQRRVNQRKFNRWWDAITKHVKSLPVNTDKNVRFFRPYVLQVQATGCYLKYDNVWKNCASFYEAEVRYCFDEHEQKRMLSLSDRFGALTIKRLTAVEYGKHKSFLSKAYKRSKRYF